MSEAMIAELAPSSNGTHRHPEPGPVRLNLGGGAVPIDGFMTIDRRDGREAYPLDCADGSVDEILASHILEHFSHRDVSEVLQHWYAKLKPGGKIRLAVPDFEYVARQYLAGAPINIQGYVMGGHQDADDKHGCVFDRESLTELLILCGFERVSPWSGGGGHCASLECSLNLQAYKPSGPERTLENVRAVLSTPRFGPLMHPRCAEKAFYQLRIKATAGQSCFWHQKLSALMEECIADPSCEFVLTMDFDTVFCAADIMELYRLLRACPEADAVFPLQSKRGCEQALFSVTDGAGRIKPQLLDGDLARNLLPANTGHFGLTLFRADSLRRLPRPWMCPRPAKDGTWEGPGQVDADIDFWFRFKSHGFKAYLAPRVVVGHLEEVVKWPGKDLKPVYQATADYDETGIPGDVAR